MKDKEFLQWIYNRLVYVHNENELFDYMHKLKAIIEVMPGDQETPKVIDTHYEKCKEFNE